MSHSLSPSPDHVSIGIDIAKHQLDVHVHPGGEPRTFANDRAGHAQRIAWITPQQPTRILLKATGAYHRALQALTKAALPWVKINPWQARRFAEATGRRVKTDPRSMPPCWPASAPPCSHPCDPLRSPPPTAWPSCSPPAAPWSKAALVAQQHKLQARFDILLSIPGLGAVSVLALLIDMPELGSLDARQTASLGGRLSTRRRVAPITRQSGNGRGKSIIQGGRAPVRQALSMPALVASRCNPPLKAKSLALRQAGKPAKVAIVAIMRKLLILANARLRDTRVWTPEAAHA